MALIKEMEQQGNWLFKYRSHLPLLFLVAGVLVTLYGHLFGNIQDCRYIIYAVGIGVSLIGLLIRILTVGYTPANTSGRNTAAGQVADQLNQTGIYSLVRHPLYIGNFFMWLGVALLTQNAWFIVAFALFYFVYYERIIFAEESFLSRKFGESYTLWANKTPLFIPDFKHYRKPAYSFSWKKVVKKEKNGLLAIFTVFCLIDILIEVCKQTYQFNYTLIYLFAGALVLYLILKFLKYNTKVFYEEGR